MDVNQASTVDHLHQLHENVDHFITMTDDELFALDYDDVKELHKKYASRRFQELRPKVAALDRLAQETGVDAINELDDLVSLSFPHTIYKSYSIADLERGRFDRLTRWLGTMTAVDFSQVDISGCESMEGWLQRIEAVTPYTCVTSSGSGGKVSILPRTVDEQDRFVLEQLARFFSASHDLPGLDLHNATDVPFIIPLPYGGGRHGAARLFDILRKNVYGANGDEMTISQVRGPITADEMLLMGKLRHAESLGQELVLSPYQKALAKDLAEKNKKNANSMEEFLERAVVQQRGKQVMVHGGWPLTYRIAKAAAERKMPIEWAPESIIVGGGGMKGYTVEGEWNEVLATVPGHVAESYGMSECTSMARLCPAGHLHPRPWGIPSVVDPDNGASLGRTGTVTGRLVLFDLLPYSFWSGVVTGDEVTIHWDGGCPCGRKGPFYDKTIRRYSESQGGSDKISCQKTPDAYDKLVEFTQGLED